MVRYIIKHKYCGMTKTIEGYTVWDAFRSFGLNPRYWDIINSEKI